MVKRESMNVTEANIDEAREFCVALDQAAELIPGCVTWSIFYELIPGCVTWSIFYEFGQQRGQMTRWPDGRGAICLGGNSGWGDWERRDGEWLLFEDGGQVFDDDGHEVNPEELTH